MNSFKSLFFLIPGALLFLLGLDYFSYIHKSSFYPENVSQRLLPSKVEQTRDIEPFLQQPFHYIGEGAQCFAFESADHKYVLKLFKKEHRRSKNWLKEGVLARTFGFYRLHDPLKKKTSQEKWAQKFKDSCLRYEKAYEKLHEETGLLFLHFYPGLSSESAKKWRVSSKWGKFYELDLTKTPFILQKKAELVPRRIASLLKAKKRKEAVKAIVKLYEMLAARTEKKFTDERQCFSINFGFSGETPLQIDVGQIEELKQAPEVELKRLAENLSVWVAKHFPEIAEDVAEQLAQHKN